MTNKSSPSRCGAETEALALSFLQKNGLCFVRRNWRCRYGEIDLICKDKQILVFVEVRRRNQISFGGASSSITTLKRTRLLATASIYLQTFLNPPPCRFDAVCVQGKKIEWLKNCIEANTWLY